MFQKKSLGQNFLRSKLVAEKIIEAGAVGSQDIVLEVGPGKGALTEALLRVAREVIAVEKDDRLIMFLNLKFKEAVKAGKLKIIHQDILTFDPESENLKAGGYKLIANIPYYITGAVIRRFLGQVAAPSIMVLMLQKEVAKRIVARDGKESLLSMSVKAYGAPKYITTVSAKHFSPKPKVDSAILSISNISKTFFDNLSEEKFFETLKKGFAHKRKKLLSNLNLPPETKERLLKNRLLSENTRAEELSLSQWKKIVETI